MQDKVLLAAVADGLGGHRGGALASQTVVEKIKEKFSQESFPVKSPAIWMDKFCSQIHSAVIYKGERRGSDPMTTIVFLLIQENQAYWFYVGDSRLYYFSSHTFKLRTQDHSQVQHLYAHLIRQPRLLKELYLAQKHNRCPVVLFYLLYLF